MFSITSHKSQTKGIYHKPQISNKPQVGSFQVKLSKKKREKQAPRGGRIN